MRPLALLLLAALCAPAAKWADHAEYDLALAIRAEAVPQKRLPLLDEWKRRYPASEFQQARRELYFSAYQSLGDTPRMLDAAGEMLAAQPDNAFGAYWYALLLPGSGTAPASRLALGEKAAGVLLAGAPDAETQVLAHRALAWIRWQRSEFPAAEDELRACLKIDPARGELAAWLGTVLALEKQPEKPVPALWEFARAVGIRGAGALPDDRRKSLRADLERLYTSYHGEAAGLEQLLAAAAAAPDPPAGFTIESAGDIALRKQDEALERENPRLADWVRMRRQLEGPDGEKFFAGTLRNNPFARIKGTLMSSDPPDKPTQLVIAVMDQTAPEIVVKLSAEFPNGALSGTPLEFEGTVDSFTRGPFTLTLLSDPEKISGWPEPPRPAAKKK